VVLEDFKRALARAQSDYGFYIDCQTNPAVALAGYDLSADERTILTNPAKLADALNLRFGITVTIKGKHDWVNRAPKPKPPKPPTVEGGGPQAMVATEVEAIKQARTSEERDAATLRLMELIG
jgi:hypothetical protein